MVAKSHCRLGVVFLMIVAREQTEKLDVDTDELIAIDFETPPLKETLLLSYKNPPCPARQLSRHAAYVDVNTFVVDCQYCLMNIVHCAQGWREMGGKIIYTKPTGNYYCSSFYVRSEDGFWPKLHRHGVALTQHKFLYYLLLSWKKIQVDLCDCNPITNPSTFDIPFHQYHCDAASTKHLRTNILANIGRFCTVLHLIVAFEFAL
jgi:hypothetical protein